MRIVAGTHRGRPLAGPRGAGLRPTADRVRESLFNLLGQFFEGGEALDLYAGTGALAFEALSRGVSRAVLVDQGAEAARLVTENARALGLLGSIELLRMPVARALPRLAAEGRLLADGGTLVVEHGRREPAPELLAGLQRIDARRFGDTVVSLYRSATVP